MYDVAIIGAGPAGSTLARLIGSRYRVLLADKRPFADTASPSLPEKCCGGLLAPDAQQMLSRLGLGLPGSVLEDPQVFVVRAIDLPRGIEQYYQRHYINMNRQKFDRWLLSQVPAAVEIRTRCRFESFAREGRRISLKLRQGGKEFVEKTRVLVGADGARSRIRPQTSPANLLPRRYLAVQEWVKARNNTAYFTSLFDPDITDYYCWTIPKGNLMIVGAALPLQSRVADAFARLKKRLTRSGFSLGSTVHREAAHVLRPMATHQTHTGSRGVALIGEAAGWISPSSAEGFSYAFRSAVSLARALQPGIEGFERRYQQNTRSLRVNILLKNLKAGVIFHPALRRAVMRSGLQSLKIYR
jgi:flavin-dependent dehydrogenase